MPCRQGVTRAVLSLILLLQPVLAAGSTTLVVSASSSSVSAHTANPSRLSSAPSKCNGHSEFCTRSYSNITFVGSHDAPFVGPLAQQNQNIDIKAQLDMGIRYLQAQTHHSPLDKKTLQLCHTSCFLEDAGTLKNFLVTIKKWLDANPNEVVTLLLTNGDSVSISEFGETFSSSGITKYAYVPTTNPLSISDWPTLGEFISSGKRLVVFLGTFFSAHSIQKDIRLDNKQIMAPIPNKLTSSKMNSLTTLKLHTMSPIPRSRVAASIDPPKLRRRVAWEL